MDDDDEPEDGPKPYAAWSSLVFGLIALGLALWVLLSGDVFERFLEPPKDDPWLLASLVNGILGTLAGIVALARREPLRIALLGLAVSIIAIIAKFFLAALVIAVLLVLVVAALGGIG